MTLTDRLRDRIAREGPISFRDFMAAALYDSQEGYYSRGAAIGERGDFVTSPYVSPAFAKAVAKRFAEDSAGILGTVDFVEVGAGEGKFLEDFANALHAANRPFASRVRLTAIEKSAASRLEIRKRSFPTPVRILESANELGEKSVTGWIFSNELYDALPVVRVAGSAKGLQELRVDFESDAFDYGHRSSVLYHSVARRHGTLAVHFAGLRRGDPLSRPGQVDLTAHVHWDLLIEAGEAEGLVTVGVARQGPWLVEAGLFGFVADEAERWRAYRLIDPEGMGEELSVLVQSRPEPPANPG